MWSSTFGAAVMPVSLATFPLLPSWPEDTACYCWYTYPQALLRGALCESNWYCFSDTPGYGQYS